MSASNDNNTALNSHQEGAGADQHYMRGDDGFDAPTEEPRPLIPELSEGSSFPTEALGPLAPAAHAIEDHTQAPIAIAGQSLLGAVALATQGHADVVLPTVDRKVPLSLFLLTIAASGERKSTVDGFALQPIREKEDALAEAYREDYQKVSERRRHSSSKARGGHAVAQGFA